MSKARRRPEKADKALYDAACKGDLTVVRERIAAGANVNGGTKEQYPPLCIASAFGHLEVVRELITAGADVNQIAQVRWESFPSCPLILAIKDGHFEVAQELVRAGAKVELEVHPGDNAATEAAFRATKCNWLARGGAGELAKIAKLGSRVQNRREEKLWMEFVREALARGVCIRDYCLWSAAKNGHEELALLLIENGVNPNVAPHGSTALAKAIDNGLTKVALALLKAGADPNARGQFHTVPLLLAAASGNSEIVRALLDAGAAINTTDDVMIGESKTPAFEATGDDSLVLNVSGILSDPMLAEESTALVVAVRRGDHDIAKLLLERGADPNLGDKRRKTPLAWAIDLGCHQIAKTLRESSASEPELLEGSPATALFAAAENGDEAEAQRLLSGGVSANITVENARGKRCALHAAAEHGHAGIVRLLLQAGADVDTPRRVDLTTGVTALMLAAEAGHVETLRMLIKTGADIHAKTREFEGGNETALHYAARGGSVAAIRTLIESGARVDAKAKGQVTPLMSAVLAGRLEAAQALIASGANAGAGPQDGSGLLWNAASEGDVQMVRLLLASGASPKPTGKKSYAFPLGAAASKGSVEVVRLLLDAGAEVNAVPVRGGPALVTATILGHEDVVEALLAAGADPNLGDSHGMTALMMAVRLGHARIADRYLAAGGDLNLRNGEGKTCLDIARHSGRRSMIDCVRNAGGKRGDDLGSHS